MATVGVKGLKYDRIQYDTIEEFNMDYKAERGGQYNPAHVTRNKNKRRN